MNEQQTVIRQALDALEYWAARDEYNTETREAITALYRLLEQPTGWVDLTDAEIDKAWRDADCTKPWDFHRIDVSRAIEAKLREKNGM
jgi:hypothetical protein